MNETVNFRSRIAEPLGFVVGRVLADVGYWILKFDKADFLEEQPNASGVLVLSLQFGDTCIEIMPGWESALRSHGACYHIQAFRASDPGSIEVVGAEHLCRVDAIRSAPWHEAKGSPLTSVEVLGLEGSPQAVRFSFETTTIVVAAGYSGSSLYIGDGDELLIFSDPEWQSQMNWERLWAASATTQPALLVK